MPVPTAVDDIHFVRPGVAKDVEVVSEKVHLQNGLVHLGRFDGKPLGLDHLQILRGRRRRRNLPPFPAAAPAHVGRDSLLVAQDLSLKLLGHQIDGRIQIVGALLRANREIPHSQGHLRDLLMLLHRQVHGTGDDLIEIPGHPLASAKIDIAKNRDDAAEEKLSVLLTVGGSKDQVLRNDIKITLADLYYYKKGLLAKANPLYAEVLLAGGEVQGAVYRNYGRSLQGAKVSDKAIVIYLKALKDYEQHPKRYPADILADIYGGLGDAYYDLKRYQEGIEAYRQALTHVGEGNADVRRWLTYMIGKGSAHLKDFVGAEKSFAQVKANAVGEFWPKVADYVLERSRP